MPDSQPEPVPPNSSAHTPPPQPAIVQPDASVTAPTIAPEPPTEFRIGDEFGTAKRNLPPARIVLPSIAVIAAIVAFIVFHERPKPQGAGSVNFVTAVETPGREPNPKNTLAAITFTLRTTPTKSLWIRSLKAQLTTGDGHSYEDDAASAVDLDRYYHLFPPLKESSEPALSPETRLLPGTETRATIVVSFPVSKEAFDQRKSLEVTIQPYDQPLPIALK